MVVLTRTFTRTHVLITFANPYLMCDHCKIRVERWHDPQRCGCGNGDWSNEPCGHNAGVTSACPSWGPVDGCRCAEVFGRVDHPVL
jgi:hypothetical protein